MPVVLGDYEERSFTCKVQSTVAEKDNDFIDSKTALFGTSKHESEYFSKGITIVVDLIDGSAAAFAVGHHDIQETGIKWFYLLKIQIPVSIK